MYATSSVAVVTSVEVITGELSLAGVTVIVNTCGVASLLSASRTPSVISPEVVTPSPGVHDNVTDSPVIGFIDIPAGWPDSDHVSVSAGKSASVAVAV